MRKSIENLCTNRRFTLLCLSLLFLPLAGAEEIWPAAKSRVKFPVSPAHAAKGAAPRGGTLRLIVESSGRYRVSLTSRHWIEVVGGDMVIESLDHEWRADCPLLHKIVEYQLPAHRPLVLQLSGADETAIGLAITPSPGG